MALTQVFAAGERPSATKWNEKSIPVVSSTGDITSPYTGQLIFNTTDTRLYRYTGSAWATFSGGPTWALSRITGQTIGASAWTHINWDSEEVDTANMHSLVTNPFAITISTAGLYAITAKGSFVPNATGIRGCRVTLNSSSNGVRGSAVLVNNIGASFTTAIPTPTLYIQCAVNDIVGVQVFQASGGNLNTETASTADYPLFTGTWLRD